MIEALEGILQSVTWLHIAGVLLLGLVIWALLPTSKDLGGEELDRAKIYLNEKVISIKTPIHVGGKPDQVWKLRNGELVIVDTKRRKYPRAYFSDKLQLSLYRYILAHHRKHKSQKLASYGYVRLVDPSTGNAVFRKVELLSFKDAESAHSRTVSVMQGREIAQPSPAKPLCRACGHNGKCVAAIL